MENLVYRKICFQEEVETSIKLLKKGMGDLQNISGANDFFHVPILLLSSGYERLIKCLLYFAELDGDSEAKEILNKQIHDICRLLYVLLSVCDKKDYSSKFPAAEKDIDFLRNDKFLRKIISILSDFGMKGRYYYLDMARGKSQKEDPIRRWEDIENEICQTRPRLLDRLKNNDPSVHAEINREIIITLEKFARALARIFAKANFGDFAKKNSPLVYDYLMLMDKDLGTRDYRKS